jgi:hypothetical protein
MRLHINVAIASFCLLFSSSLSVKAAPPEIIAGTNGEAEVIFKNNCVVYYNARGQRKTNLPACKPDQVRQADSAITNYRKEQGLSGKPVADHNDPNATMTVCCEKQGKDWLTTRELCRGVSGNEAPGAMCRKDLDNRPWSTTTYDDKRVCCERKGHDWFTTRGECRHSGGFEISNNACRNDRNNSSWWAGNRGQNYEAFDNRPTADYFAGKADISLTCYGEGDKPVLENWDDKHWFLQRASFPAAVLIEIFRDGPRYTGRIHPSGRLLPPIHEGDRGGWWNLKDIVITNDEVRTRYRLNGLNKPRIVVDRRTGRIAIEGIEKFYGRCWAGF